MIIAIDLKPLKATMRTLMKRDPANTAAAERSLHVAMAIAQSQKARSFELRAALSLAKLYRYGHDCAARWSYGDLRAAGNRLRCGRGDRQVGSSAG